MVYIFFVQSGTMMTFENEISIMQSVADLKRKIFEKCHIPIERQVLLISGGEPLDSSKNLCSYMAGTDTNPIYLFSTNFDVSQLDSGKYLQLDDEELRKRLIDARCLPISVNTVKTRTLVSQDFASAAKDQLEFCENLVHEQHLQQQGWFAVIANLEDIGMEFRKRWELFQRMYREFRADRATYDDFLVSFEADKRILQKIPVVATLLESGNNTMEESKSEIASNVSESESDKEITLYDWISSDNKNSLDELYELCKSSLSKFEQEIMPSLTKNIDEALLNAETTERKEIEGLEKRLCDLDDLVRKVKAYVECQTTMAQSFLQHKQSVTNIKDNSILPELSVSHMHQLTLILETHEKLMEDRNRIIKAKFELSKSLCFRIGWVQQVEGKLWELDNLLVYFHEHLQRLRKHLEVFQQLHIAPIIYMNALVEVVRRRLFSQLFLLWASDLACQQLTIYNEEVTRRKDFNALFDGHFLSALFPGMSDIPPTFATEAPTMFDAQLPNVSAEDIEKLRKQVPDFIENLIVPDMSHVANFFTGKVSGKEKVDDIFRGIEDKLIQAVSDVGLASQLDQNMLKTSSESCLVSAPGVSVPKDDKGCESETDTEEFEKVGQSPMELGFPQGEFTGTESKVTEKIDVSTITEVRNPVYPPKKTPRFFRSTQSFETDSTPRTLSISMNESFTNLKNSSLDSIDEMSSLKVFTNNTDSCFNSHYNESKSRDHSNLLSSTSTSIHLLDSTSLSTFPKANTLFQHQSGALSGLMLSRSKSVSPQSPRDVLFQETSSPNTGMQSDFSTDEYYIDESMPSSVGTGNSQGSEFVRQLDTANIVIAMLQENLQISRLEHEKLKNIVVNLSGIAKLATANLRTDLNTFKVQFETESRSLSQQYGDLGSSWETLLIEVDKNEQEIVRCMRQECSEQKDQYQYNLMEKEELIKRLDRDNRKLENDLKLTSVKVKSLEALLDKQNTETASKIETLTKQLQQKELDHRTELDNIKSRFKMITMEKSPSLTSLEKERSSDFALDSTLFLQMTENFELDKAQAVAEERARWELILEDKVQERCKVLSREITRRISHDKDLQIDALTRRETDLNLKIIKYQTIIDQLTDRESNSETGLGQEFEKSEGRIEGALSRADIDHGAMTFSTFVDNEKKLESTFAGLTKSEIGTGQADDLNFNGFKIGALVLVCWDEVYKNYTIYQHSKQLYFLHFDSLANLGLNIVKGQPNKTRCIGQVIDKELCETLKETNRLNIPKGTKFFLVKVKPVNAIPEKANYPSLEKGAECSETATGCNQTVSLGLDATCKLPDEVILSDIEKQLEQDSAIVDRIEQASITINDSERSDVDSTLGQPHFSELGASQPPFERRSNSESEEIELLKRDNQQLKDQLASFTGEKSALMTTSVAVYEGKMDAATSPLEAFPAIPDMSRSETSTRPHRLSIDSCKIGDVVLLLWDPVHENFKILQESKHTYFPHSDCLEKLGLLVTEGKPNKLYCLGEVVDREYCQTRKSENRYKVPKGAKFFRVKLKPISAAHREAADLSQSVYLPKQASAMSTSHSVATTFGPLVEETQCQFNFAEMSVMTFGSIDNVGDRPCPSETVEIPSSDDRGLSELPAENPTADTNEKPFAEDSGIQEVFPGLGDIDGFISGLRF
ncbi:RB1-inducible coiled-coil protein 1 isoform X3 [Dendroctonus ponderosae]|uniref:RB1-inducible coiled-coil protein 1 isoform X3 n=1 Tax=Dendroctonus ponderosae TaxID=77166 RepID=UPI002034C435|nr:RB1-inducible coiled-coil protein 1 isoform X3 [Dendroctonus ponderosae]